MSTSDPSAPVRSPTVAIDTDHSAADVDAEALVLIARSWLPRAHAPYSQFAVAAIAVDDEGRHHAGVNVENASYGLTVCAERVAIFAAVTAGARRIRALAVSAAKLKPVTPCGACRQVMAEFCDATAPVYADAGDAPCARWTVGALLPAAFDAAGLKD